MVDLPILVMTVDRDPPSAVLALEQGADDVLAKPCSPRELVARVQAIVRGRAIVAPSARSLPDRFVHFSGWRLDRELCRLTSPRETIVDLSKAEYRLLDAFVRQRGRILDRDRLVGHADGRPSRPGGRRVDLSVSRLRRKLFATDRVGDLIRTVHGEGHFLDARIIRLRPADDG